MWKTYIVTLKDGAQLEVQATNEYHAGSIVVYDLQNGRKVAIDGETGRPVHAEAKVHRDNIDSIVLK